MSLFQHQSDIINRIRAIPALSNAGVGYEGNLSSRVWAEPRGSTINGIIWVVIEDHEINPEVLAQIENLMMEPKPPLAPRAEVRPPRDSHLGRELIGAGFSCTMAVVSGAAVVGGGAAAPATGGASIILTTAAWTGFITGSIQCGIGIGRVYNELFNPTGNDYLDNDPLYQRITFTIDLLGVASGIVSAGPAVTRFAARVSAKMGLSTTRAITAEGRALESAVAGSSRVVRRNAIRAAISEMDATQLKDLLKELGIKEFSTSGRAGSIRQVRQIISQVEANQLSKDIKDLALFGLQAVVNLTPDELVGSASGSLNALLVNSNSQARQDLRWINTNIINITN